MHKAATGFVGRRQKTAKTCCGRTVKVECIAIDSDATCPGCLQDVAEFYAAYADIIEHNKGTGLPVVDLIAARDESFPTRFQTVYFF